ncbi:hypothetical protein [Streptomyces tsukubensis]
MSQNTRIALEQILRQVDCAKPAPRYRGSEEEPATLARCHADAVRSRRG